MLEKLVVIMGKVIVILTVIFFLLVCAICFNGCGAVEAPPKQYEGRMKSAGDGIYIDTETGVCYFGFKGHYTVMVDREGKPFIANGWRDFSNDDE